MSVVNALSKRLVARVKRDGGIYEMEFARGKTVRKMERVGKSKATGTSITFWPDDTIFESTIYDFDTSTTICRRLPSSTRTSRSRWSTSGVERASSSSAIRAASSTS